MSLKRVLWFGRVFTAGICVAAVAGCDVGNILKVPPPAGTVSAGSINGTAAAEALFYSARMTLFGAAGGDLDQAGYGTVELGGLLTDEFTYVDNSYWYSGAIDFRTTTFLNAGGWRGEFEQGDLTVQQMLAARSELLLAAGPLATYETGAGLARLGEDYALTGYAELLMAETFCAGVTLSQPVSGGGVLYGSALTTDSLLEVARAHFDSAAAHAAGNDTIVALAAVGLGRTWLDLGQYDSAAKVVASVPTSFSYDVIGNTGSYSQYFQPTLYEAALNSNFAGCGGWNVADSEGMNGLGFLSANDPRLTVATGIVPTCDNYYSGLPDSVFYFPVKFGNPSSTIPLATGLEARLIEAEAALPHNGGNAGAWLADLNALRNSNTCTDITNVSCALGSGQVSGQTTGVFSLADPGTDDAQVSLMYRERAFWLFGTGTRLGDLRRLIRQYHRPNESVFPTGSYAPGNDPVVSQGAANDGVVLPTQYGKDVTITLPTSHSGTTITNPNYKGCLNGTTTA